LLAGVIASNIFMGVSLGAPKTPRGTSREREALHHRDRIGMACCPCLSSTMEDQETHVLPTMPSPPPSTLAHPGRSVAVWRAQGARPCVRTSQEYRGHEGRGHDGGIVPPTLVVFWMMQGLQPIVTATERRAHFVVHGRAPLEVTWVIALVM
jgi:hypothetical protein